MTQLKKFCIAVVAICLMASAASCTEKVAQRPASTDIEALTVRTVLSDQGIYLGGSNTDFDTNGRAVCSALVEFGISASSVQALVKSAARSPELSNVEAAKVVGAYVGAYCPEFLNPIANLGG